MEKNSNIKMNTLNIVGLQTTTLLDYPGKVACTIFLGGCNFRCPFCQNAALVLNDQELNSSNELLKQTLHESKQTYTKDEIMAFLQKRKNVLEGVCVSGGEPTLCPMLPEFLCEIKNLGYAVKLDTNGYRPDVIKMLYEGHLVDYVAMDIKSSKEGYAKATGIPNLNIDLVCDSVNYLITEKVPHEFRTTLVKGIHTKEDIISISKWIAGDSPYYLQSYSDSELIIGKIITSNSSCGSGSQILNRTNSTQYPDKCDLSSFSKEELKLFLEIMLENLPNTSLRGID